MPMGMFTCQGKYKKGKTTTHFMMEQRVIRPQQYSMQGLVVIPDPLSGTQTTSTYADMCKKLVTLINNIMLKKPE